MASDNDDLLIDDFLDDDEPVRPQNDDFLDEDDDDLDDVKPKKAAKKKPKKPKKTKASKPKKPKDGTAKFWLMPIIASWLLIAASIATIEFGTVLVLKNQAMINYGELIGKNINSRLRTASRNIQSSVDSIAKDPEISRAFAEYNSVQQTSLESSVRNNGNSTDSSSDLIFKRLKDKQTSLSYAFNNIESIQLIPWSLGGTAALKRSGFTFRNNTELSMLTSAAKNGSASPEIYKHDKTLLVSFVSPIVVEDNTIGFVFLTLKDSFVTNIIGDQNIISMAGVEFVKDALSIKKGSISKDFTPISFTGPFAGSDLKVSINPSLAAELIEPVRYSYAILALSALIITIITVIGLRGSKRVLTSDIVKISHFTQSQVGIHETHRPDLDIGLFTSVIDEVERLGSTRSRSAVNPKNTSVSQPTDRHKSLDELTQTVALPEVDDGANEAPTVANQAVPEAVASGFAHPEIFRDYDIRGIADEQLTDANVTLIGKAIGSEAIKYGTKNIAVGRDGRVSSDRILNALSEGICSTGCSVIDVGQVPTPALYFATHSMNTNAGVMITASHNPAEYNGFKIVLGGKSFKGDDIQALLARIQKDDFESGSGQKGTMNVLQDYISEISSDIIIAKPLKVVIDAANGMAGSAATELLEQLDCEVVGLNCNIDGNFPNHAPDPTKPEHLQQLIASVASESADIGIAFDGDADRMVAVTPSGYIVPGDQLLMIFANDVVSRNPAADVVFDVKCSRNISQMISQYGGRPVMWKTGHSNIKAKMEETGALLGGEFTGHFFFKERWYGFDDGIYSALRLLELLTAEDSTIDERVSSLPTSFATAEMNISLASEDEKTSIIKQLEQALGGEAGELNTLDGIRLDYQNGWGLVRASNTSLSLSTRFEANSAEDLAQIQQTFKQALQNINGNLVIPF